MIRDVVRLGAVALALTVPLIACLVFSELARAVLEPLRLSRSGHSYVMVVVTLGILTSVFWAVPLGMLFTTPEQHDRFASGRRNTLPPRNRPYRWPDASDPDYRTPVWRYWLSKIR